MANDLIVTEEALRRVMREEINSAFVAIGLDPETPLENQKKMAFLAMLHTAWSKGGMRAFLTVVGIVVTAGLLAALMGLGVPAKALWLFGLGQ